LALGIILAAQHIAYLFAVATGIVSSGAIGSLWSILAGEAPSFKMLGDDDLLIPIKVPVVILSGPTTLMLDACWWLIDVISELIPPRLPGRTVCGTQTGGVSHIANAIEKLLQ
jgi:hypothetical protein